MREGRHPACCAAVIDQFFGDRDVIASTLVVSGVNAGTKGVAVNAREADGVPRAAWLAADRAFESPEWSPDRDELAAALTAAAPHIRVDELDALIRMISQLQAQTPVLGRKNSGRREGLNEVIKILVSRKRELKAGPS